MDGYHSTLHSHRLGIGLAAYLIYGLVYNDGLSIEQAFTSCMLSGVLLCMISIAGWSDIVMGMIPKAIKLSTIVGMGLQVAFIGLTSVNVVVANPKTIVGLGPVMQKEVWISILGLVFLGTLLFHKIKGAILVGIIGISLFTWTLDQSFPTKVIDFPSFENALVPLSLSSFDAVKMIPAICTFLFIGVVDVSGVVFGMASLANLTTFSGNVPGSMFAFLGCGVGTILGAAMGSSPVIVYVESAAGIQDGGRSGLTAIVTAILFLLSIIFAPLFTQIPSTATSSVAILVGAMMMGQATEIDWSRTEEAIPAFLTMTIMPFTFSISNGIVIGLFTALLFHMSTGALFNDLSRMFMKHEVAIGERQTLLQSEDVEEQQDWLPVVRAPSLILDKKVVDKVREARGRRLSDVDEEGYSI